MPPECNFQEFYRAFTYFCHSIHLVHDDAKDKEFELELTWISPESALKHTPVPEAIKLEAVRLAKVLTFI